MLADNDKIMTKVELKDWLRVIDQKYGKQSILRYLFPITELDVLRKHQILLRKAEYYTNTKKKIGSIIYRILLWKMQNKYALQIPLNTCGKGLKIMHVGPVLINGRATLGENCSIHINTAIIAGGPDDGAPSIGNNVVIGVGAVIIGSIKIGDYSTIGANAVVTKSFDQGNITIAGVPAKMLHRKMEN